MVPDFASSIEGACGLVLAPRAGAGSGGSLGPLTREDEVLLAYEYGRWGLPGGAVNAGESCVEAMRREVQEEVGVHLTADQPLYLGGWNQPRSREDHINDHYHAFLVQAQSL